MLPQSFDSSLLLNEDERVQKLALEQLTPTADQPRRQFDEQALAELAESIRAHGILQPLVVAPGKKNEAYRIIAGERRYRAAKLAGLTQVPVIVRTLKEQAELEVAIIENVQRVDLSPLEQAMSIERLHQQFGLSYDAIAKQLGKANSTVNNIVRLLQLPEAAQAALNTKKISEGHARAILSLKQDTIAQEQLLKAIQEHSWSVREAERFVTAHKAGHQAPQAAKQRVHTETPETKALSARFNTQVQIRRTAKGGRIEITFGSDDDLQQLLGRLQKS